MFNFLESHLTMMINKEVKRPSKFPEAPAPEPRIPVAMSVDSMEEEKVPPESPKNYDASGYFEGIKKKEEEKKEVRYPEPDVVMRPVEETLC